MNRRNSYWSKLDILALAIFFSAMAWGIYEIFVPASQPDEESITFSLTPKNTVPPDLKKLEKRVLETQPILSRREWRPPNLSPRWRWIVVHHSATISGNAEIFAKYHTERGMENGLAYHFIIGNGHGMKDGEVEVCDRWMKQLDGGHVHGDELNKVAIGICLVGNFEDSIPTRKQISALKGLLKYLMAICQIPEANVNGHKEMNGQSTKCPGRYFPLDSILKWRLGPGSGNG